MRVVAICQKRTAVEIDFVVARASIVARVVWHVLSDVSPAVEIFFSITIVLPTLSTNRLFWKWLCRYSADSSVLMYPTKMAAPPFASWGGPPRLP